MNTEMEMKLTTRREKMTKKNQQHDTETDSSLTEPMQYPSLHYTPTTHTHASGR